MEEQEILERVARLEDAVSALAWWEMRGHWMTGDEERDVKKLLSSFVKRHRLPSEAASDL